MTPPVDLLNQDVELLDQEKVKVVEGEPPLHCAPSVEVCGVHLELVKVLRDLVRDIKWMIQIGRWVSATVGVASLILVGFVVHAWDINKKLAEIDTRQMYFLTELQEMKQDYGELKRDFIKHLVGGVSNKLENSSGASSLQDK